MSPLHTLIETYQGIIDQTERDLVKVKRQIYRVGTLRLVLFIAGIVGIIHFWSGSGWALTLVATFTFVPFVGLIKFHSRLFNRKEYLEKKIEVNQQELRAMDYDTSAFDGGSEYIDPAHLYSYDLDVFGEHSLFQYINRTSTELGKKRLAHWFGQQLEQKAAIEKRQEAISELTPELHLRQQFRIFGLLYKGKLADGDEIKAWAASPSYYRTRMGIRILPAVVCTVNVILIGLSIAGLCSSTLAGTVFVGFSLSSFLFSKGISKIQTLYGKRLQVLGTYANLIHLIEEQPLKSQALRDIKELIGGDKQTASQAVARLTNLMNALDQRNNVILAMILNGFFFWELRQMMRIEAWKEQHAGELPYWLEAIAEMDAYCSLSTFAYNHPDYVYPQPTSHPFNLQAQQLGHPLMPRSKCVRNSIEIDKRPFFIIITGANMAGKSTYLRTVGVNYLLACIGAPVWANEMTFYPSRLVTSLRTSDSLNDNESYFFAELKRLKLIIDKLNAGKELFIILDEILKGTNSMDKQKGSFALIKQFMALQANGIIATHDLLLGTLVQSFPTEIHNYCFEAEITNNELTFSYQMKEGVAQNMNACFLMKKMGIAVIND
ncbi:MutS family DNA mismatch repair protein [Bacteroides sp.]|uniref:MutS family DNA mismatch repair protein n=1 Tax=Bacteroides sp. TaxID=29523 RepID=UPI002FC8FD6B